MIELVLRTKNISGLRIFLLLYRSSVNFQILCRLLGWYNFSCFSKRNGKVLVKSLDCVSSKLLIGTCPNFGLRQHHFYQLCQYPVYLVSGCLLKYFSCFIPLEFMLTIAKISLKHSCSAKKNPNNPKPNK